MEKILLIANAQGFFDTMTQAMFEKCTSYYTMSMTCDESYVAYQCTFAPN